jgi:hypothetical protein
MIFFGSKVSAYERGSPESLKGVWESEERAALESRAPSKHDGKLLSKPKFTASERNGDQYRSP